MNPPIADEESELSLDNIFEKRSWNDIVGQNKPNKYENLVPIRSTKSYNSHLIPKSVANGNNGGSKKSKRIVKNHGRRQKRARLPAKVWPDIALEFSLEWVAKHHCRGLHAVQDYKELPFDLNDSEDVEERKKSHFSYHSDMALMTLRYLEYAFHLMKSSHHDRAFQALRRARQRIREADQFTFTHSRDTLSKKEKCIRGELLSVYSDLSATWYTLRSGKGQTHFKQRVAADFLDKLLNGKAYTFASPATRALCHCHGAYLLAHFGKGSDALLHLEESCDILESTAKTKEDIDLIEGLRCTILFNQAVISLELHHPDILFAEESLQKCEDLVQQYSIPNLNTNAIKRYIVDLKRAQASKKNKDNMTKATGVSGKSSSPRTGIKNMRTGFTDVNPDSIGDMSNEEILESSRNDLRNLLAIVEQELSKIK
eukprot:g782.t1